MKKESFPVIKNSTIKKNTTNSDELKSKEIALMALQIGFTVAFTTILFVLGGRWLDGKFQTAPIFILSGIVLALIVSFYLVWQIVKPLQEKAKKGFEEIKM